MDQYEVSFTAFLAVFSIVRLFVQLCTSMRFLSLLVWLFLLLFECLFERFLLTSYQYILAFVCMLSRICVCGLIEDIFADVFFPVFNILLTQHNYFLKPV